ncbi:potassium-transporting ATPase potassium-binding subunit [Ktedonobacteria bacterium brp13]|nr:potassium-transporting ATPase potassium-binding subunit [Ktedonobacteria bacterium brp13]
MSLPNIAQYVLFLIVVLLLVKPLGGYMARVFTGERTFLDPVLLPIERFIYRITGINAARQMSAKQYTIAFLLFSMVGTLLLYALLRLQMYLPWYDHTNLSTPMTPDLAGQTAFSFSTTTTWQAYAGETTMSYFSQIVGLAAQNFLAGAAGLAVGIAFIRGFAGQRKDALGNFWSDLVRSLLWVLIPLSLVGSVVLIWQGVPMNFNPYTHVTTLEGGTQTIAQGPVAALEFIKNLGTNGGGFFNVNGAHPFENPTPLTNFIEMLAIVVLPAALTNTFGRMVGRPREGWMLFWVMTFLFIIGLGLTGWAEQSGNPQVAQNVHLIQTMQNDGNMEGKEVRFGIGGSVLTAVVTSNGATGSTNSMHDSYTPLGGSVPLVNMLLGEIIYGGLGTGLYSIILVVLLGLFITGLMVGRTPEYLGKKLDPSEIKLVALYTLIGPVGILLLTAIAVVTGPGLAALTTNSGPHGLTEILYAYTSSFANNGQAFAGISANTPFYNITTAIAMVLGRFGLAIPALALAKLFALQPRRAVSAGTLSTDTFLFSTVVVGTAILVVALTYLPAIALGPIVEHILMIKH